MVPQILIGSYHVHQVYEDVGGLRVNSICMTPVQNEPALQLATLECVRTLLSLLENHISFLLLCNNSVDQKRWVLSSV